MDVLRTAVEIVSLTQLCLLVSLSLAHLQLLTASSCTSDFVEEVLESGPEYHV